MKFSWCLQSERGEEEKKEKKENRKDGSGNSERMKKGANKGGKKWLWRSGLDVKETVELKSGRKHRRPRGQKGCIDNW